MNDTLEDPGRRWVAVGCGVGVALARKTLLTATSWSSGSNSAEDSGSLQISRRLQHLELGIPAMGNQAGTLAGVIYANDLPGVRYRLELGDDVNERRGSRYTPLITAAYYNRCEVLELLLDRGADIEAVEKSGLSALRTAIHYNNEEAAKLLAARGADANTVAYQNKTALYAAVEKSMRTVVEALLQNGADPCVKCGNDKSVFDLVSSGDLWDLLHSFTSFDVAIDARSVPAVTFFLKKTLARSDSDDILKAYATVKAALGTALGGWQERLSKLVCQFEIDMLRDALRSRPTDFVDKVNAAVGKPSWLLTVRMDERGRTALHTAVLYGDIAVVCHLLENYQCEPNALDDDGCKAADLVKEDDALKHISWILAQHEKKARFNGATCRLMGQTEMSALKLLELPQFMTSIYDMRVLFCLGYGVLTASEMKQLIQNAFTESVRKKLMFDDDALTFFKTVLDECKCLGLISQQEKYSWEIQAGHVNGANADWVRDIQNAVAQLEHRVMVSEKNISSLNKNFHALRSSLENKKHRDADLKRRRQLITLVTCGLLMCGGSAMVGAFSWAFKNCDSASALLVKLTKTGSSDELARILGNAVTKHVLQPGIIALLEQAGIDQTEFKTMLGKAVALDKAAKAASSTELGKCSASRQPKLHLRDVVARLQANMKKALPVDHSRLTDEDLKAHPYHFAVLHSSGDVDHFKALIKHLSEGEADVNATMEIRVPATSTSLVPVVPGVSQPAPVSWELVQASPASYASYLGYVGIVDWFLVEKKSELLAEKTELSYVMVNRAHRVNKRLQSTTTA